MKQLNIDRRLLLKGVSLAAGAGIGDEIMRPIDSSAQTSKDQMQSLKKLIRGNG